VREEIAKEIVMSMSMKEAVFSDLQGLTLKRVEQVGEVGDDRIEFETVDGRVFVQHHNQDCCEGVGIESVVGEFSDLIGTPILLAEVSTSEKNPPDVDASEYDDGDEDSTQTWTFYKLRTIKGSVDIRWYGSSSNGHYSVEVDFEEATNDDRLMDPDAEHAPGV
jgi:hypothetical protein